MFTGWAGWGGGVGGGPTVQKKMIGVFAESVRQRGASPKITETLVKTERGSREDEPAGLRAGRVSFFPAWTRDAGQVLPLKKERGKELLSE